MSQYPNSSYRIPEHIRTIQPYPAGKPADVLRRELGVERLVHLASNENTAGPSPRAVAALREAAAEPNLYPDGGGMHLTEALAAHHGVGTDQIVLGCGSAEIIDILCRAFVMDGEKVVTSGLGFAQYWLSAHSINADLVKVPPPDDTRKDLPRQMGEAARDARLAFIANPNNPTGTYWTRAEVDEYFEAAGDDVLTVLDQAYFEYVEEPDYPDALDDLKAGRNVIVLRTFSKIHGLAGLRIGYGVAPQPIVEALHQARLPFNASSLAQAAALAALGDEEHVAASRRRNREGIEFLTRALEDRGLRVTPSVGNFLLFDVPLPGREVVKAVERRGVLIRGMGGYGLPDSVRVTVGSREENEAFLAALDDALAGALESSEGAASR